MTEQGQTHQFWYNIQKIIRMFDIAKEPVVNKLMILNQHELDGPNWSQKLGNKVEHKHRKEQQDSPQ